MQYTYSWKNTKKKKKKENSGTINRIRLNFCYVERVDLSPPRDLPRLWSTDLKWFMEFNIRAQVKKKKKKELGMKTVGPQMPEGPKLKKEGMDPIFWTCF